MGFDGLELLAAAPQVKELSRACRLVPRAADVAAGERESNAFSGA
jgi:hypothetical protein